MNSGFHRATSFNADLPSWVTSRVTDMGRMFWSASSFNQTLCWNTSIVIISLYSAGKGLSAGSGSTDGMNLLSNESIVGLQVFSDSLGIHVIRFDYAEFPSSSKCYDSNHEPTDQCPTIADYLAIVWGILTVISVASVLGLIVACIRRRRHKEEFRNLDTILPIRWKLDFVW